MSAPTLGIRQYGDLSVLTRSRVFARFSRILRPPRREHRLAGWGAVIRTPKWRMSSNVIQKELAFAFEQSSTVITSRPTERPEILPRQPER